MRRAIVTCISCGERHAHAGRGRCFKCYRRFEREVKRVSGGFDPHAAPPQLRAQQKRLLGDFHALTGALAGLGVAQADVQEILRIVTPYLELIQHFLTLDAVEEQEAAPDSAISVNKRSEREHALDELFTPTGAAGRGEM